MLNHKKAQFKGKIESIVLMIILVIVLFSMYSSLVPEVQSAGDSMNDSNRCADVGCAWNDTSYTSHGFACVINSSLEGNATACGESTEIPLSGLFSGKGIMILLVMVGLLLTVLRTVLPKGKK